MDFTVSCSAYDLLSAIIQRASRDNGGNGRIALEKIFMLLQSIALDKHQIGDTSPIFDVAFNKFQDALKKEDIARLFK